MEEEGFFYYLTHGSKSSNTNQKQNALRKEWDEERLLVEEDHQIQSQSQSQSQSASQQIQMDITLTQPMKGGEDASHLNTNNIGLSNNNNKNNNKHHQIQVQQTQPQAQGLNENYLEQGAAGVDHPPDSSFLLGESKLNTAAAAAAAATTTSTGTNSNSISNGVSITTHTNTVTESTSLLYPTLSPHLQQQQEQLQLQQHHQHQHQQLPASPLNPVSYLLPPMNGTINYSNLKTSSLPSSLQNSRHSASGHGGSGSPAHNFAVGVNGTLHYSQHGVGINLSSTNSPSSNMMRPPVLLERNDSFFKPLSRRASSSFFEPLSRRASSFVEPFNDHTGAAKSVIAGLFNLAVVGTIIGLVMPKNDRLPTPWYRLLSSVIGYSYFIFWCASFYPQIVMNFQRKSTEGLSIDYSVINFLGYICYTSYTSAFYWDGRVREMYRERHFNDNPDGPPAEITVESNDVAFAIHALIMSIIWLFQLQIYGGFDKCRKEGRRIISRPISILMKLIVSTCSIYGILIICSGKEFWTFDLPYLNWLDYLYYLSFMKVVITTAKYIPQALMNMRRKSCVGWNIWNILLDISGGILSLIQLVGDAVDLNDLSSIAGNSAKLGLSGVSIFFDIIFLLQHYVWYPEHDDVKKDDNTQHDDDDEDLEYASSENGNDDDIEYASSEEDESEPFKKGTNGPSRNKKFQMVV